MVVQQGVDDEESFVRHLLHEFEDSGHLVVGDRTRLMGSGDLESLDVLRGIGRGHPGDEERSDDGPNPTQIEVLGPRREIRPFSEIVLVSGEGGSVETTLHVPGHEVLHPIPIRLPGSLGDVHLIQNPLEQVREIHDGLNRRGGRGTQLGKIGGGGHIGQFTHWGSFIVGSNLV